MTAGTVTVEAGTPLKRLNVALAARGPVADQHGRHHGADGLRRHQHRHPRHGPRLGLDRRPDQGPGAGHGRRLGADLLGEGEPGGLRGRPDRPRRARRRHRDHLRRGAGLPAHGPRGADALRPGHWPSSTQLVAENEHFEFYWFPHTGNCNTKRNNRSAGPAAPLPAGQRLDRGRAALQRRLPGGLFARPGGARRRSPAIARISSRALSARTYTDIPYKVFTSPAPGALRGDGVRPSARGRGRGAARAEGDGRALAACGSASRWRCAPRPPTTSRCPRPRAGTARTSPSTCTGARRYQAYFTAAERIMTAHGGRPHWGKVHTRDAEYFAGVYPRFGEFTALRDRLDPDRRVRQRLSAAGAGRRERAADGCVRSARAPADSRETYVHASRSENRSNRSGPTPAPVPTRSSAARRSTHVARMEYCGEPWVRSPVRASAWPARHRREARLVAQGDGVRSLSVANR